MYTKDWFFETLIHLSSKNIFLLNNFMQPCTEINFKLEYDRFELKNTKYPKKIVLADLSVARILRQIEYM